MTSIDWMSLSTRRPPSRAVFVHDYASWYNVNLTLKKKGLYFMSGRNNFFPITEATVNNDAAGFFSAYQSAGELVIVKKTTRKAVEKWLEQPTDDAPQKIKLLYELTESSTDNASVFTSTKFSILPPYIQQMWTRSHVNVPSLNQAIDNTQVRQAILESIIETLESLCLASYLSNKPVSLPAGAIHSSPWNRSMTANTADADEKATTTPRANKFP